MSKMFFLIGYSNDERNTLLYQELNPTYFFSYFYFFRLTSLIILHIQRR